MSPKRGIPARALAVILLCAFCFVSIIAGRGIAQEKPFLIKPYLQLGYERGNGLSLVWFAEDSGHEWRAAYKTLAPKSRGAKTGSGTDDKIKGNKKNTAGKSTDSQDDNKGEFLPVQAQTEREINLPDGTKVIKYTATIEGLKSSEKFAYQLSRDDKVVFTGTARGRSLDGHRARIAVFGDCGANTAGQRKIANESDRLNPDLVFIPGDIVYQQGLFSQYLTNFFPIYESMMAKTIFASALGNHDIALSGRGVNLDRFGDALAYYIFFNQPLNGFSVEDGNKNRPSLLGDPLKQEKFRNSAGNAFPRMANYSFDIGDSHWTVLDGNFYMDWTNEKLRQWLKDDLAGAQAKPWRIVTFHQPAFSIDHAHASEQRMRLIIDLLEQYKVDLVICGHAHCYERSYPLTFSPPKGQSQLVEKTDGTVDGEIAVDSTYDGKRHTKPKGIIHVVTGAGGARLYHKGEMKSGPGPDFIAKFDASKHSFSYLDIKDKRLSFEQISEDGELIDRFEITK